MKKVTLTNGEVTALAIATRLQILSAGLSEARCYAIPRGGISAAYAIRDSQHCPIQIVSDPAVADFFIDDLIDSGDTMKHFCDKYPCRPFFALIDKTNPADRHRHNWVIFPWEVTSKGNDESATDIVVRLLQYIGEDPTRGGLLDTPKRVIKAWSHWTSGYGKDIPALLKTFTDGAEDSDEMVVRVVPFYSHCEHHLAAIIGHAVVAYIPDGKIVGLSKIDRVVDAFARRLQVQERLTTQIADAIWTNLEPKGVGVWINARHLCIESRGVENAESSTDTLALRGVFKDQPSTRAEFLAVARGKIG